jgi:hypothetical protein
MNNFAGRTSPRILWSPPELIEAVRWLITSLSLHGTKTAKRLQFHVPGSVVIPGSSTVCFFVQPCEFLEFLGSFAARGV